MNKLLTQAQMTQPRVIIGALLAALLIWFALPPATIPGDFPTLAVNGKMTLIFGLGLLLGLTLYHAAFGFAGAYRRLLVDRDASGVQAQLLMIALATLLFAPFLAAGQAFGSPIGGALAPLGVSVAVGAFMFGIGMQLGNGCGSGTLFALGGGSPRMLVVLIAFCGGSFWASLDMAFWQALPDAGALALGDMIGWPFAVLMQLTVLLAISRLLQRYAPASQGIFSRPVGSEKTRWRYGAWPVGIVAILLALLNLAVLLIAGHPWTITWAYTLWGAKAATLLGWQASSSDFWQGGFQQAALGQSLLADTTSLMDIGILIGALLAAGLAGRFAPQIRLPWRSLAGAVIGGLLMGMARASPTAAMSAPFSPALPQAACTASSGSPLPYSAAN